MMGSSVRPALPEISVSLPSIGLTDTDATAMLLHKLKLSSLPCQLVGDWEGDLGVVELLHVVALAQRRRHRGGLDDADAAGAHAMPRRHLLVHLRHRTPAVSGTAPQA